MKTRELSRDDIIKVVGDFNFITKMEMDMCNDEYRDDAVKQHEIMALVKSKVGELVASLKEHNIECEVDNYIVLIK